MKIVFAAAIAILTVARGVCAQDAANRPDYNYRGIANPSGQPAGRQLYKNVDEKGRVVYTDAPKAAGQKGAKMNAVNVESPEARRQMSIEMQTKQQEEYAERAAAARRAAPIQQREYLEAAKKRREEEAQRPEYAPRPLRVVPYQ
jgi:pyridoxine/pyridoxamine 5'-phosphate oxidase